MSSTIVLFIYSQIQRVNAVSGTGDIAIFALNRASSKGFTNELLIKTAYNVKSTKISHVTTKLYNEGIWPTWYLCNLSSP